MHVKTGWLGAIECVVMQEQPDGSQWVIKVLNQVPHLQTRHSHVGGHIVKRGVVLHILG